MVSTLGAPRQLLRRLREVMAARESVQERLDKVVTLIAGNMVANHHRERAKRTETQLDPATADTRSDSMGQILRKREVEDALAQLSEPDQEILGLCYYSGLKPQEIAMVVGSSQAAVHKRLHRARQRMRSVLEGTSRPDKP